MIWTGDVPKLRRGRRKTPSRVPFDAGRSFRKRASASPTRRCRYAATGSRKPRFVIWIVQDIRPPFQSAAENRPGTKPLFLPAPRRRVKRAGA